MSWITQFDPRYVQAAQKALRLRGGDWPPPPGADGLSYVEALIDDFAHDTHAPESHDDCFVDGVGALFGCLLLDAFGGCFVQKDTEHRVLVGEYGTYNPFVAIDDALDAEDPKDSFRKSVSIGQEEGKGTGPCARIVRLFWAEVASSRPDLAFQSRYELLVTLRGESGEMEVNLERMHKLSDEDDDALRFAATKIVGMLPGTTSEAPSNVWDERERVLPRIVHESFVSEHETLHQVELSETLRVCFVIAYAARSRFLTHADAQRFEAHDATLAQQALLNLSRRSAGARFERLDSDDGSMVVGRTGDGLDSARVLLPALPEVLAPHFSGRLFVGVPHRDTLLISSMEHVGYLERSVSDRFRRAPHAIDEGVHPLDSFKPLLNS